MSHKLGNQILSAPVAISVRVWYQSDFVNWVCSVWKSHIVNNWKMIPQDGGCNSKWRPIFRWEFQINFTNFERLKINWLSFVQKLVDIRRNWCEFKQKWTKISKFPLKNSCHFHSKCPPQLNFPRNYITSPNPENIEPKIWSKSLQKFNF